MVIDEQNVVRLANGKLAGSTNHLNNMVRNLVEKALLPEVIAINSVTKNPARLLNVNESMGEIKLGLLGNFTIIDEKYEVLETLVNGETVYKSRRSLIGGKNVSTGNFGRNLGWDSRG